MDNSYCIRNILRFVLSVNSFRKLLWGKMAEAVCISWRRQSEPTYNEEASPPSLKSREEGMHRTWIVTEMRMVTQYF